MDCVTSYHPQSIYTTSLLIIKFKLLLALVSMYANCAVRCFQWMKNVDFPYIFNVLELTSMYIVQLGPRKLTSIVWQISTHVFELKLGVEYSTSFCQRKGSAACWYRMLWEPNVWRSKFCEFLMHLQNEGLLTNIIEQ